QTVGDRSACIVRVAAGEEALIKRTLDLGADGIIVPQVNSAEQAEQVVRFARYAPQGARGVGLGRAQGYGLRFQEYVETANERVSVIVQAEHFKAVENIEAIVQVPGVDAVLIGPYDLAASLGKMGQVQDPAVLEAVDHVTDACRAAGMPLGAFGLTAESVKPYAEKGFTFLVAGVDTLLLGQSAAKLLAELRS
ncbi:MAG: aldolase/citrate lyase family protein, partial [Planctomycetales bacterium]